MSIRVRILIDDSPGEGLKNEHGLSILIETAGQTILFDTGQSSRFAENAEVMGIRLETADFAVVSHGHYDHGDGLSAFFERNLSAPVYMHPQAEEPVYFSRNRTPRVRYVGIDPEVFTDRKNRFRPVTRAVILPGGIHLRPCTEIPGRDPIVKDGSLFIREKGVENPETFEHEIFMVLEREHDFLIISGCSHNNIASIIEHCINLSRAKTLSVIGGFHMPEAPECLPNIKNQLKGQSTG